MALTKPGLGENGKTLEEGKEDLQCLALCPVSLNHADYATQGARTRRLDTLPIGGKARRTLFFYEVLIIKHAGSNFIGIESK